MDFVGLSRAFHVGTISGTVIALGIVAILLSSGIGVQNAAGATGVRREFFGEGDAVTINFTKTGGEDNTDYTLKLPKESNVLSAQVDLTGTDVFKTNQVQSLKTAFDWRIGSITKDGDVTTLIYDTDGLHLDMDSLAPFSASDKKAERTSLRQVFRLCLLTEQTLRRREAVANEDRASRSRDEHHEHDHGPSRQNPSIPPRPPRSGREEAGRYKGNGAKGPEAQQHGEYAECREGNWCHPHALEQPFVGEAGSQGQAQRSRDAELPRINRLQRRWNNERPGQCAKRQAETVQTRPSRAAGQHGDGQQVGQGERDPCPASLQIGELAPHDEVGHDLGDGPARPGEQQPPR